MEPKVSVIIPVYNAEKYLRECLDSVVGQTLQDIEIICVDAGSTDSSAAIIAEYQAVDSRVVFITDKGRLDAGSARNIGMEYASGKYLSILDADDFFEKEMLEETYKKACSLNADVVVYGAKKFDMRKLKVYDMPWALKVNKCPGKDVFSPVEMKDHLFNSFQNWTWNKLFSREFIRRNNIAFQSIARTNDMAFVCQALAVAERIAIQPVAYTTYRVAAGGSLQDTNEKQPFAFWDAYKETKNRLETSGVYQLYEKSFCNRILSGYLYNLDTIKNKDTLKEVLSLINEELNACFKFDTFEENFFYSKDNYKQYKMMTEDINKYYEHILKEREKRKILSYKLVKKARNLFNSLSQNGIAYTIQIIKNSFK